MNRGADRRDIFEHDTDRQVFLDSAVEAAKRYHLEIHAYCLMTNHFHMLLRSQNGQLAAGMQFLSGRFTRLVNVRAGRDGPLFRSRYASISVASDTHLVQACRYIHLNPAIAGMRPTAESWPWSSAAAYVGSVQAPAWLRTDHVLELFGPPDPLAGYRDFMKSRTDDATLNFYAKLGW
jgi:putative transposase